MRAVPPTQSSVLKRLRNYCREEWFPLRENHEKRRGFHNNCETAKSFPILGHRLKEQVLPARCG
jgi:hypothetical protein